MIMLFVDTAQKLTIDDLTTGNVEHLSDLERLFADLFPQYQSYISLIRQRAYAPANQDQRYVTHQWLARVDGQPAGLSLFDYVPGRLCGTCLYLAVAPRYREYETGPYHRLAEWLLKSSVERLQMDARQMGQPDPVGLVLEVETPKLLTRYGDYGFIELPIAYYEPGFEGGYVSSLNDPNRLDNLSFIKATLGIMPTSQQSVDLNNPAILRNLALAFLVEFYGLPEDHWLTKNILRSIQKQVQ
jgi:hypothetical protein